MCYQCYVLSREEKPEKHGALHTAPFEQRSKHLTGLRIVMREILQ